MSTQHQERKEYLVGKMRDGAKALYDFFEALQSNRDTSPTELASRLAKDYELTPNQKAYFNQVAIRAARAQGIVRYLGNRFGLDAKGEFENPEELYLYIFPTKKVPPNLIARSYNVAVGFIEGDWQYTTNGVPCYGFTYPASADVLNSSLEETISELERGRMEVRVALSNLSFSMADLKYFKELAKKGARIDIKTAAYNMQKEIERHELRHIFDKIIGVFYYLCNEFVANLYQGEDTVLNKGGLESAIFGLRRDSTLFTNDFKYNFVEVLAKIKIASKGGKVSQRVMQNLERYAREGQMFEDGFASIMDHIVRIPEEDYGTISFLISGMVYSNYAQSHPHHQAKRIARRLELIAANYA